MHIFLFSLADVKASKLHFIVLYMHCESWHAIITVGVLIFILPVTLFAILHWFKADIYKFWQEYVTLIIVKAAVSLKKLLEFFIRSIFITKEKKLFKLSLWSNKMFQTHYKTFFLNLLIIYNKYEHLQDGNNNTYKINATANEMLT